MPRGRGPSITVPPPVDGLHGERVSVCDSVVSAFLPRRSSRPLQLRGCLGLLQWGWAVLRGQRLQRLEVLDVHLGDGLPLALVAEQSAHVHTVPVQRIHDCRRRQPVLGCAIVQVLDVGAGRRSRQHRRSATLAGE
eukprot:scaffold1001_cov334-Prasinococcus_capsulatus_cf.AAC.5